MNTPTMKTLVALTTGMLIGTAAIAQQPASSGKTEIMSAPPKDSVTVTDWYKQSVYDPSDSKIGEIMDVLMSPDGHVTALVVGVGGFLGAGEKDVAVPFSAVKHTMKNQKVYLTMDTTKDALKAAPGVKYDRERRLGFPKTPRLGRERGDLGWRDAFPEAKTSPQNRYAPGDARRQEPQTASVVDPDARGLGSTPSPSTYLREMRRTRRGVTGSSLSPPLSQDNLIRRLRHISTIRV